jgi:O-antigen ligase
LTRSIDKVFLVCFTALLIIAAACYAYWGEVYLLMAPLVLLACLVLVQHPRYLFYLLIVSIPWSFEFHFDQSLGTDLPDEPLMLLASLSIVLYIGYNRKSLEARKVHPLLVLVMLQLLWTIITVVTSSDWLLSVKYLLAKSWYLLAFLVMPVMLFRDQRTMKTVAVLLVGSTMVVTTAILVQQGLTGWTFKTVSESVKPFFKNHVNYSSLLVFMVPLVLASIMLSSSKKLKMLLYLLAIVAVVAIYFSYARGAWLALLVGLCAYWLLRKRLLVFAFACFISLVIGLVFWLKSNDRIVNLASDYRTTVFHTDFRQHLIATYRLKDLSNAERLYRWIAGIRMAGDDWQTGTGPSTFYPAYKSYTLPLFKTYVSDNPEHSTVHNYFLLTVVEQGVIGLLLLLTLFVAVFWLAQKIYVRTTDKYWRVVVATVSSILLMQCVINFLSDMIETDKVGSVFYLCIAALIVADLKTRGQNSNSAANVQGIS